ncbi:MAG: ABC transporter permease, partial [Gammaproteobacteria bacterium]
EQTAHKLGLKTAYTTAMRSVVSHGDNLQLVELKAVSDSYPLRGQLLTTENAAADKTARVPTQGTIWVEQRLLDMLAVRPGDTINLGAMTMVIDRVVLVEPDRAGSLFNLAPRVLMNFVDIEATKLLLPGSRVTHNLLVAGEEVDVRNYKKTLSLRDTDRIKTTEDARPEIRSALDRADHFLNLAVLTAIVLSAVAIALAARAYTSKNAKACALLRVLGATRGQVLVYFVKELGLLTFLAIVIGVGAGFGAQFLLTLLIKGWVQGNLPPPGLIGITRASFIGLTASLGFALPYLLELPKTPPGSVLRPSVGKTKQNPLLLCIFAVVAVLLIAPWDTGSWQITLWVGLGIIAAMTILAIFGQAVLTMLYKFRRKFSLNLRFGATNLWRRKVLTQVQVAGLALGLTALFTLALVRTELLESWVAQLPERAPNQFLINIQSTEREALREFFSNQGITPPDFHPMTRARLISINGRAVDLDAYKDPRAKRLANRDFNLSSSSGLKPDNKIVAGAYWANNTTQREFSFEKDIAETLGLELGDVVEFAAAGENLSAEITSLRTVQWETMGVNFFVEGTPALLHSFPATYITSFYLAEDENGVMAELVRKFPSVTVLDVSALITQVKIIMDRAADAIEFVAIFTLLAGVLVLISAIQTTQQERNFSTAIVKTFGGTKATTLGLMANEFIIIGAISGTAGAITAQLCTWAIASRVLQISFQFDFWLVLFGALVSACVVTGIGLVAVTLAFRQPSRLLLNPR